MKIKILKDFTRLPEIYKLRVKAYSTSLYSHFINNEKYPNGLSDHLEEKSVHFIVKDNDQIIGTARLTEINSIKELPYHKIFSEVELPKERPFWFFSKLVVSPSYKGLKIREQLDNGRFKFLNQSTAKTFALMTAKEWRAKELIPKGCKAIGKVNFSLDNTYPYSSNENTFVLIYTISHDV